ncbi:hypothetical protein OEZ85_007056 [Tetradesmus obliquus]|uniref:Protein SCAI n=1 Tax=Tetradesmus obliquus TaxID=3088 RepID=A0ABY8TYM6_TETOB|nr:hypothetical protein OEZ85_007056 [Tetradesmus obliquus]
MSSRELFKEFEFLLEKSQRSFNRLRDLPPYGNSRWEHHFHKAFHIYSKLWKFQQDNREVLTTRGMERWEIGDIASKIGQLYYNYYLRASEIRFLHESYVFYEAIRSRAYFAQSATDPNLAIKQLRYFARFIIICLLLNRREEVWQLLQEFQALISSYIMKYNPPDAQEWRSVIQEVTNFLHADVAMPVPRSPGSNVPFRHSLRAALNQAEVKSSPHKMLLHDAILVSYYTRQVKIAELPLDSFRMLQALEWEDQFSSPNPPAQEHPMPLTRSGSGKNLAEKARGLENGLEPGAQGGKPLMENPAKHLVYRPTAMQLLSILTTTMEVMPKESIMLLYISASSARSDLARCAPYPSTSCLTSEIAPADLEPPPADNMSDVSVPSMSALTVHGGPNAGEGVHLGPVKGSSSSSGSVEAVDSYLLPEDLLHLTRRSLFLVVDSDNSSSFMRLQGCEIGQQAFCLMSPTQRPYELGEASKAGNLLTMFLTGPLMGFCLAAGNTDPSIQQLVDLQSAMNSVMGEWAALLLRSFQAPGAPKSPWSVVFRDALLRRLTLRFVLCRAALTLHTSVGGNPANLPRVFPELPKEVAPDAPDIVAGIQRLAECLDKAERFGDRAASMSSGSPMSTATHTSGRM